MSEAILSRFTIELARRDDLAALPAVEAAAATLFAGWPIEQEGIDDETAPEEFAAAQRAGRLWVARDAAGPVGFALVDLVGGAPHLEEIDVAPAHGRRGIGAALVRAVQQWVRASGHRSLTLTTFRDVPWNAPFYARLGFRAVASHEWSPALRALVDDEASRGLDPAARVVMRWTPERNRPPPQRGDGRSARTDPGR